MGFISGFQKNMRVMKISQILGQPFDPYASIAGLLARQVDPRTTAENEMYAYIESDPDCLTILQRHHGDRERLRELYWLMMVAGAGTWIYKHYVPVTALCFPLTLDYLLANRGVVNDTELVNGVMEMIGQGSFDRMP